MEESRRVKMTKRLMKEALLELMEQKPITSISVTEVCKSADVNRSTFYVYYKEPADILEELENELFAKMPELTDMANVENDSVFIKQNTDFFDFIKKNSRVFKILLIDSESSGFYRKFIGKVLEKYDYIERSGEDQSDRYRRVFIANGAVGMMCQWIEDDFSISSSEFIRLMLDVAKRRNT